MSRHALSRLVLPNLRTLVPIAYRPSPCSCRPAYAAPSLPFLLPQSRSYASKKKGKRSSASTADDDDDDDAPAASQPKGKGVKKGKAQFNTEEDQAANGGDAVVGAFDMKLLEASMDDAVQKLRVALKSVVGRVGRVSPGELPRTRLPSCTPADDLCLAQTSWMVSGLILETGRSDRWASLRTCRSRMGRTSS
jgi:hypothetical protein